MIPRQDMEQRFGAREIDALTDGSEDTLSRAIEDAQAEAAGYLAAAGFRRPFSPVPRVLVLKICDIARYYLHQNRDIDIVDKRYKAAASPYAVIPNRAEDFDAHNRKF